jgi:UDP-glucose 4-epimerase
LGKVLVTGGCGYIGSHTIVDLLEHGHEVISVDNLSNSSEEVLEGIRQITGIEVKNYATDLKDPEATQSIFEQEPNIDAVIHFAAFKAVGESIVLPLEYYRNNVLSQINILECIARYEVPYFVFSSSCSVYGDTKALPVREDTPWKKATSPYGRTKQLGERMSEDVLSLHACRRIYLRYFNPVGAHPSALIGEAPGKPLNIVPIMTETAAGVRDAFTVFGDDYPTEDGSCIRDYIHVMDVARAHTMALEFMINGQMEGDSLALNLGIGKGLSVLELIAAFEKVTGVKLNYRIGPRRPGDVAAIYADPAKAKEILAWEAEYSVDDMMGTAWSWEKKRRGILSE